MVGIYFSGTGNSRYAVEFFAMNMMKQLKHFLLRMIMLLRQ